MFNQSYANDFDESMYQYALNNPAYLDKIKDEYLKKYGNESNAYYLAFKESLDHYIAKKISEDKNYINSSEFRNYFDYLREVVNKNVVRYGRDKIFLEVNTNVVFEYLDEKALQKITGKNYIKDNIVKNEKIIKSIMDKVNKNGFLNDEEIRILGTYFDSKKDFKNPEFKQNYNDFIRYILNNRKTLRTSPELISSILTFLPSYYRKGVEDIRTFAAKYDDRYGKKKIGVAHSSGSHRYTAFEISRFKNMQLSSNKSLNSSRSVKEIDLMFLLFVQFHELTHQVQKNRAEGNNFNIDALPYEIKCLLNIAYKDYLTKNYGKNDPRNFKGNHDSDEIEIDADFHGWKKLQFFIFDFMDRNEENEKLSGICHRNAVAVNCRRSFSLKESPVDRKRYRTMDYDMIFLRKAIKDDPSLLNKFNHLKHIITPSGEIKTDILFENVITMSPAGRTISNYILNHAPTKLFIDKINSGKYSKNQICNLTENFLHVSHENALTLRGLGKVDLKTFEETHAKFNIKDNLDDVYNAYFIECAAQLLKFSKILETIRPAFGSDYVNSCYDFYMSYYGEMLGNINCPDTSRIESVMKKFEESKNPVLNTIAVKTRDYIQNKSVTIVDPSFINNQSKSAIKNSPDSFCRGLANIPSMLRQTKDNIVVVKG